MNSYEVWCDLRDNIRQSLRDEIPYTDLTEETIEMIEESMADKLFDHLRASDVTKRLVEMREGDG